MAEVVIAPCRRLGANRSTSINDIPNLPLGSSVAHVVRAFNDDVQATEYRTPYIKDAHARDDNFIEQQQIIETRTLVGKKSDVVATEDFDLSAMRKYNDKNAQRTTENEIRVEKESHYNLMSLPFTTPDKFIIPQ